MQDKQGAPMAQTDNSDIMYTPYDVAQRWVDDVLPRDRSLFTPAHRIWSLQTIDDLRTRIVNEPDEPLDGFLEKLEMQLHGAGTSTIQLAAETLCLYYLIISRIQVGQRSKRTFVQSSDCSSSDIEIPLSIKWALDNGTLDPGPNLRAKPHAQLQLLLEFARRWKLMPAEQRADALSDPWAFKEAVFAINIPNAFSQQSALLHLVYPDTFEPEVSRANKTSIVEVFGGLFADRLDDLSGDLDRDLDVNPWPAVWHVRQ